MSGPLDEQGLREAFASLAEVAGDGSRCPLPDRLWASAREELSAAANEGVILHLADCTACAVAWRLARELAASEADGERAGLHLVRRSWAVRHRTPLLTAAALVVALAGALAGRILWRPVEGPVYRGPEERPLETRVPAGASLPRGAFLLRWSEAPEGTTYDLVVTSDQLEPLVRASALRRAEYLVEEKALAPITSGERVLWRVTAHLPDGRVVASRTFVSVVQ